MSKQGEPPTRVLPLPLLGKGIHPFLRFRKDRGISPSAEGDLGLCPKYPQAFGKGRQCRHPKSFIVIQKLETIAPDGIDILHSKTKTFPLWFVRTLCAQPSSEVVKIKKEPHFLKIFERWGFKGEENFLKKFSSPSF